MKDQGKNCIMCGVKLLTFELEEILCFDCEAMIRIYSSDLAQDLETELN